MLCCGKFTLENSTSRHTVHILKQNVTVGHEIQHWRCCTHGCNQKLSWLWLHTLPQDETWLWTPNLTLSTQGNLDSFDACFFPSALIIFPTYESFLFSNSAKTWMHSQLSRPEKYPLESQRALDTVHLSGNWLISHLFWHYDFIFLIFHINALFHNLEGKGTSDGP